jgi:hypothetical protein
MTYLPEKIQWVLQLLSSAWCIDSWTKTQLDLAGAASITEMTIRNKFKNLKNRLELQLDWWIIIWSPIGQEMTISQSKN